VRSIPAPAPTPAATSVRQVNAGIIWRALRDSGPMTGSELMALSGLSRPTVHAVCDDLITRGLVTEIESRSATGDSGAGRPARQYEARSDAGHVVAIDLGAKKVTVAVADLHGTTKALETVAFRDERVPAAERMDIVRQAVRTTLDASHVDPDLVLGVAMGVPSPVDGDGHVAAADHYLPGMARLDLRSTLEDEFGWSTLVENDANLAVIGERWRGVAQGVDDVVEVLAGYRLGSGVVLGGRLLRGTGGGAGELKFLGLVEGVGNTDAIAELAEVMASESEALGRPLSRPVAAADRDERGRPAARIVLECARSGDPVALDIVERIVDRLARALAVISTFLNPSLIVIGGGVAGAGDLILPGLRAALPDLTDTPPRLEVSSLGDHAVVTGAVRTALDEVEAHLFGGTSGPRSLARTIGSTPVRDGPSGRR
jgi:predicted NBD/HSP70 family sugar kinase